MTEIQGNNEKGNTEAIPGINRNLSSTPKMAHNSNKLKSISELKNFFKYEIQHALILFYQDYYRLIVIHENELLTDSTYKTFKGAKIAFCRKFMNRAYKNWNRKVDPIWSEFRKIQSNIDLKSIYLRMSKVW